MSQYDSKEFKELKQKWYKKLQDDGFSDIETFTNKQGYICNNPFVNSDVKNLYKFRSDMGEHYFKDYAHQTFLYFSALRSFLTHQGAFLPNFEHKLLELHAKGMSLRKISKHLEAIQCRYPPSKYNGKLKCGYSVYYLHGKLKDLKEKVRIWNLTHDEGIRYSEYDEPEEG